MTGKIKFRELRYGDKNKLFEIYSDKEAMKYRGSRPMESIEDANLFIQNQKLLEGNILTIRQGVELVKDRELIGCSMYKFDKNKSDECEIGYSIGRKFWGRGLGKEIVHVLLKMIAENKEINDVIAWSNAENIASIKILEYNGFHRVEQDENQNNYLYRKAISKN